MADRGEEAAEQASVVEDQLDALQHVGEGGHQPRPPTWRERVKSAAMVASSARGGGGGEQASIAVTRGFLHLDQVG
ncbi:MAG: hypothetical protein IPK80_20925 [Nannocystis sp.]|nr:hypothetical protein [Nannocystis sp.]